MKLYYLKWVLVLLVLAPGYAMSQSSYYWADGKKIKLTEDRSAMMIHYRSEQSGLINDLQSLKERRAVKEVQVFPQKERILVQMNESANRDLSTEGKVLQALNVQESQIRSAHFAWRLEDGFQVFQTHEIVLQLKPDYELEDLRSILNQPGVSFLRKDFLSFVFDVSDINQVLPLANALEESGMVEYATPDLYAELTHHNDPLFGQQFQMHNTGQTIDGFSGTNDADCNALEAWGITLGSSSVRVAVIDDGVEAHEDMGTPVAGFTPATGGNGTPSASGNHGQACAGIIAADHNGIGVQGVAPDVEVLAVNIFAGGESTQDLANAITWAKNNGADVMSNSWGYTSCTFSASNLTNALNDANSNGRGGLGCVIVFSSGNGYKSCVDYPGNVSSVVAVGAFGNDGIKSSYSNAGTDLDISAPSNDISSQGFLTGAGVRTTDRMGSPGYASGNYTTSFGGTSAACPVVAGVAALVVSVDQSLTSTQVKNILYTTAKDFGASGFDNSYGWGAVNAEAAVIAAGGSGGGGNPACGTSISSYPYSESFESGTGAWTQISGDDLDWTRDSGGTPSNGTGPATGAAGSWYMYIETSGNGTGFPNKTAGFESPCFDLTSLSDPEFSFQYHMQGSDVGNLQVQVSTDGSSFTTVRTINGNQGSAWGSETIDMAAYGNESAVRIRFFGTSGTSWQGDIAIDDVRMESGGSGGGVNPSCSTTISSFPYGESFESGIGAWSQVSGDDLDWTRDASGTPSSGTGPGSGADGSWYMYIEASGNGTGYPNKTAIFESPCFDLTALADPSFNFSYHMYSSRSSSDVGTLLVQGSTDGTNYTTLATISGSQGNTWNTSSIDLSSFASSSGFSIRFRGTTASTWRGDIAIDDVSLTSGSAGPSCTDVTVSITLDNYPGETSWQITQGGSLVASGGTYGSQPDGSTVTVANCLSDGCYDFTIFDSFGDGICCAYGNGSYSVTGGGSTLASGGSFGTSETTSFCVSGGSVASIGVTATTTPKFSASKAKAGLSFYPNPVSHTINLEYGDKDASYEARIIDMKGRMLWNSKVSGGTAIVDVADLPEGIYFFQVMDQDEIMIEKFVKE